MGVALGLRSVAIAIAAMALNVAFFFLWVFLYSMVIAPGQEPAAYEAYANRAAPWGSVIAGIPILFAGGWLLARWHGGGWRTGIAAGIAYAVIDLVILSAAGALFDLLAVAALSWSTKIAAAALGGSLAGRRLANA